MIDEDRYSGVVTATTPDERTVFTYDTLGRSSAVDDRTKGDADVKIVAAARQAGGR